MLGHPGGPRGMGSGVTKVLVAGSAWWGSRTALGAFGGVTALHPDQNPPN